MNSKHRVSKSNGAETKKLVINYIWFYLNPFSELIQGNAQKSEKVLHLPTVQVSP